MNRNLITILSLLVMSLMFNTTGAYAQSYVKANVPFAFNAGARQLPAGTYEIKVVQGAGGFIISIQNDDTATAAMSIARREGPRNTDSKLVFHRVGGQYFLAEIWTSSDAGGMIVPTSKLEKEREKEMQLAKGSSGGYEKVTVALK